MCTVSNSPRPHYRVHADDGEWIRINYDTGAAVTAFPLEFGDGLNLHKRGEFKVASGDSIPDYGRVRIPGQDEFGNNRGISGAVTSVHKPLCSATEVAKAHDAFIWEGGGAIVPKAHPVATGMRRAWKALTRYYGQDTIMPLYKEGRLYNFYVKQSGPAKDLNVAGADFHRPA